MPHAQERTIQETRAEATYKFGGRRDTSFFLFFERIEEQQLGVICNKGASHTVGNVYSI